MPKFIGKITRDEASDFKLVPAEDVDIRGANDLTNITLSDDDYIIVDDASIFTGIDSGTEDSTGKVTLGQLKTYIGASGSLTTEEVQDIVGDMFDGGVETRISATYDDSSGKINLVVYDMTQDTVDMGDGFVIEDDSGDEVTITENKEVAVVGGTGITTNWTDIDNGTDADPYTLTITNSSPNVTQTTISGNAGTATALETSRNIGGVAFDGTSDITLPGVNSAGNQNTSGTAAKATAINTTSNGFLKTTSGNGTISVGSLASGDIPDNAADTSGTAATVTTNANLTGHVTSSGNATSLGAFTIANLNTALSDATLDANGEANVQSDWNSSSGDSQILNKPTIPVDLTVDGAGTVHANNYTNTEYTVGDGGLTQKNFTTALNTKLGYIAVTQAVDLDTMETATTNNVNRTMDSSPTDGNSSNSVSSDGVFDALATKLNLSGGTMTGALTMSSGDKLQFVDSNEFLSSDGTDLTIGSGGNVKINPAGGQVIIEDDDTSEPILEIKSTADATGAGGLRFTKDRGSAGSDNDNIGIINWYGKSSDNGEHIFAQIYGVCTESDASNEEGRIKLNVTTSHSSLGSITTTGLQLDGTTTDGQIDVIVGAGTGSTTDVAGNLTVAGNVSGAAVGIGDNKLLAVDDADAADDDYAKFTANGLEGRSAAEVKTDLSLNNVSNDAQMPLAGGIFTGAVTLDGNPTNDLHVAPKQYVDGKRFAVTTDQLNYRMGTLNTYYVGNQTLGTGVAAADFQKYEAPYAVYTAKNDVKVHCWTVYGSVSSTVAYEYELWDTTNSADGGSGATAATKVGSTQAFNGIASRMYSIGEAGLDYTLSAGHQLYVVKRYTSGSGNKYTYATVTVELEVI